MNTVIETITPAIAAQYLKKNTNNRNLRDSFVYYLANEMIAGRWQITNQGIAFFADGQLADGQHRLQAVVQSGITIKVMVTRGLPLDAMSAIDVGAKRSVADFLHLHHGVTDANNMAAGARQIVSIFFGFQNYPVPPLVVKMVIDNYSKDLSAAITSARAFKPASKSWLIACLAIAHHRHAQTVAPLLAGLATGEGLKRGDPAHAMREWLVGGGDHFRGSYTRPKVEAALNILMHQVLSNSYRCVKSGVQGFNFFIPAERKMIEAIREEIAHLIKR